MSDWDDDDYDPKAEMEKQMADKIASLGLDDVVIQQQKAAAAAAVTQQLESGGGQKKNKAASNAPFSDRELSEQEKREAQLRADADAAMDLFGLTAERKEPTYETLRSKADFQAYADKLGVQLAARHNDPNYLEFVNLLIDHLTKPMAKNQLQTIKNTVQVHLDVFLKREEQEKKAKTEQLKQKESKKAKTKIMHEDVVEDDYDDYDEKFHRY